MKPCNAVSVVFEEAVLHHWLTDNRLTDKSLIPVIPWKEAFVNTQHTGTLLRKVWQPWRAMLATILVSCGVPLQVAADPASPVSVVNSGSPNPVASGAQETWTITVTNTAGSKLTNVVLSDQLNGIGGIGVPPQLALTTTKGSCSQNALLVNCNIGTLQGGASFTVTIRGVVTASSGTTINNTATVSGTRSAQTFNTTQTASVLVSGGTGSPLPDLALTKTGPSSVPISSPITYHLTVNNIGAANATNIRVVDTLPAGVTGISASGTSLFSCSVVGQTVTCDGGAVNAGANATITIAGTTPAAPTSLTNTAVVDPDNTIAEGNELNNTSATVNTAVTGGSASPLLTITNVDTPDPISPGQELVYTLVVKNVSGTRANDVRIIDGTQGLEPASISASQVVVNGTVGNTGGCVVSAPQVVCSIRTLNAGGTQTVTVRGQVIASAGTQILNTGVVSANVSNVGYSYSASSTTSVKPGIDLTVTKSDSPDPVCARSWPGAAVCGGGLTYTFVVGNSGVQQASDVVLRDPLPPGLVFDGSVSDGGFTCAVDGANVVTCSGGTIPAESTRTVTLTLVAPPSVGVIANTVTVDPNNAIFEADETNNTFTQTTQVNTGIDLTVTKTDAEPGFDPIATSGTQTYTIIVDNIGTQDATNIVVRDTLPASTTFLSASGDKDFSCSHANGLVTCVGGRLLGTAAESYFGAGLEKATITVKVFARPSVGTMHNEVRVDPDGAIDEVNENNNLEAEDTNVVNGGADKGAYHELTIAKVQASPTSGTSVAPNGTLTYQITVGNDATDPVNGVAVRDDLPAGMRFVSASGTNEFVCIHTDGVATTRVDCTGGSIAAGGSATIDITVFAPATPGTYRNEATVDPDGAIAEGNETNNTAAADTTVALGGANGFNELSLSIADAPDPVTPLGLITYTLTVANSGTDTAFNVAVRNTLPEGAEFVSAVSPTFSCSSSGTPATGVIVDCTNGTVTGGGNTTITILARAPNANGPITDVAVVDPGNSIPEADETNNGAQAQTIVQSVINLKIRKNGPAQANQSTTRDYVITVVNEAGGAGATATGVKVVDPLPVGMIPLTVTATSSAATNFQCQVSENPINRIDCIGDLNPEQEVTITATVFITAEDGTTLDNEACVDPEDLIEEFDPPGETDNCSTLTTAVTPPAPDLVIDKDDANNSVEPGAEQTYTLSVSNDGTQDAAGPITITDVLPDAVTYQNAFATNGFTCDYDEPSTTVTCTKADGLAVGESTLVTIEAAVSAAATVPIHNTASVAAVAGETAVGNNSDTVITSLIGTTGIDLVLLDVADDPDPVPQGDTVTYTLRVANAGTAAATNVKVRQLFDNLTGMTPVSQTGSQGFACAYSGLEVVCTGDLDPGASTTIKVVFQTTASAPAEVNSTVTVDPLGAIAESDEANNEDTEVTTITSAICSGCIDLVMNPMLDTPDPVAVDGNLSYTVTVGNVGDQSTDITGLDDVLVYFDLIGDFDFVSYTTSAGFDCTPVSVVAGVQRLSNCTGELGPGEGAILTITVTPNAAGSPAISATATADPVGLLPEFNELNNGPATAETEVTQ